MNGRRKTGKKSIYPFRKSNRSSLHETKLQMRYPLELKKQHWEWKKICEKIIFPSSERPSKLVVHSFTPLESVALPRDDQVFTVLKISGLQYKVTKDDTINGWGITLLYLVHRLYSISDDLGTPQFTVIVRPIISEAKVYVTVEQQALSQTLIVFKKESKMVH